jgi:RNA-binding protein
MAELTNKQIRKLKGLAQRLEPVLKVGKQGVTAGFIQSVTDVLGSHELIKLKFSEHKEEKHDLSEKIAQETGSVLVTTVGHTSVFYRENPDPTRRKIKLEPT